MKKKLTIKIPYEVSIKIQALQYECESRKDLLTFMINNNTDIANDNFKKYHKEYQDFFTELNLLKEEMKHTYLDPKVPGKIIRWNLDFSTYQVDCFYEEKS